MTIGTIDPAAAINSLFDCQTVEDQTILALHEKRDDVLMASPGLRNVALCSSSISAIDGENGRLLYRGAPIETVIQDYTFDRLIDMLAFGDTLDDQARLGEVLLDSFDLLPEIKCVLDALPETTHPANALIAGLATLPAVETAFLGPQPTRAHQVAFLIAQTAVCATYWTCKMKGANWPVTRRAPSSLAEAICVHLGSNTRDRLAERMSVLDVLLMLHAEHEMNCSTTAVRTAASAGTDLYTSILAAVAAFKGPRHGGASNDVAAMYDHIGQGNRPIEIFLAETLIAGERLSGFGHRVYSCIDPRAKIMIDMLRDGALIEERHAVNCHLALQLVEHTAEHPHFVSRGIHPNPDLVNGLLFQALGFPPEMNSVVLCMSRVLGWASHWIEETDSGQPIIRPRQITAPNT